MGVIDQFKNMFVKKNAVNSTPVNFLFAQSTGIESTGVFDRLYKNSDIQSCVDTIAENIAVNGFKFPAGSKAKRFQKYFDLICDEFDLLKHDYAVARIFGGELIIVPVYNIVGGIACIKVFGKDKYKKVFEGGDIKKFEVQDQYGTKVYDASDVLYRQYNRSKSNRLSGYGYIDALCNDILIDIQATIAVERSYKHISILSKFFKVKDNVPEETEKQFRNMLSKFYSGTENSGKNLTTNVLDSIQSIPFESITTSADRMMTTDKICSRFRVNKELLGYSVGSGSEAKLKQIHHNFQNTTMRSWNKSFEQDMNLFFNKFSKLLDSEYIPFQVHNDSSIDTEDQTNVRNNYLAGLITHNQALIELGYEPYEGGDTYYEPKNIAKNANL